MKICPNCGNQLPDENVFCNNCGTNVSGVSSVVAGAAVNAANASAMESGAENVDTQTASDATAGAQNFGQQAQGFNQNQNYGGQTFNPQPQMRAYDPADHTAEFDPRDIADNKLFAVLPYLMFTIGIIAALLVKESAFCRYHAKNAIRLEIAAILAVIPAIIPVLGWIISAVLFVVLAIVNIIAIVYVLQGKAKDLPIVGSIGFLK